MTTMMLMTMKRRKRTNLQTSLTSSPTSLWVGTESSISFKQLANPNRHYQIYVTVIKTLVWERGFNILPETHQFEECRCRGQNPSWCQLTLDQSWHSGQFFGPKILWRGPVRGPQEKENQGLTLLRLSWWCKQPWSGCHFWKGKSGSGPNIKRHASIWM